MATDLGKISQTLEGEYDSSKIYNKLDTVTSNGSSYVSKINNNNQPLSNNLAWQLSAKKGSDGIDGTNAQSFNFKGNVENYPSLPNSGNTINDAYYNEEDGLTYIYNGNSFPAQGKGVDFKGSNKIPIWSAKNWNQNDQVIKNNVQYIAPNGASASDIPGESAVWVSLTRKNNNYIAGENIITNVGLINGFYVNSLNGNLVALVGLSVTDFIDISDAQILELDPNLYQEFAYYDSNFNYLMGSTLVTKKVRKPKNVSFVRYTIKEGEDFYLKLYKEPIIQDAESKISLEFSKQGFFVNATVGVEVVLPTYSYSDFIPVKAGDIVRYKFTDIDGSHYVSPKHLAFFNTEMKYVSGNTSQEINTAPSDGFVIFSTETDVFFPRTVLTINENNTDYGKINLPLLIDSMNVKGFAIPELVIVSNSGGGHFKTINEAVEYGKDRGIDGKPFNILFIGKFNEHVNIAPYHINLFGLNPQVSIITTTTGDYYSNPLNISGRNSGANFTAFADYDGLATPTIYGYGVHADSIGAGRSVWRNCEFLSKVNSGIGLGTQDNQHYEFLGCRIENQTDNYDAGGLYMHNSPHPNEKNMSVLVKDCSIYAAGQFAIRLDDANANAGQNDDDGTTFTFINNNVWSEINGRGENSVLFNNAPTTGDIGQIKIGLRSFGNNVLKINK